jgi:plastin-1
VQNQCNKNALKEPDLNKRAEMVLENAAKLNCRKFLKPRDIVAGNPKLNLAFVANLFNTHPGLEPLTEEERGKLEEWLFASEGTREARAFALWINSLGIDPFVHNLFEDLRDGLVLLRVMDKINPGCVDWSKVNTKEPLNKFKKVRTDDGRWKLEGSMRVHVCVSTVAVRAHRCPLRWRTATTPS